MLKAEYSWAFKVRVKPRKILKTKQLPDQAIGDGINKRAKRVDSNKKPADDEIVSRSTKDLSRAYIAALPRDHKWKTHLKKNF